MRPYYSAIYASLLLITGIILHSCSKDDGSFQTNSTSLNLPDEPYNYQVASNELAQLGRVLFYDRGLSLNGSVSCGSCHKQSMAFADNKKFSDGFQGQKTKRNTPPIQNLAEQGQALFWDGRSRVLEDMVVEPIFDHIEMGIFDPQILVERVEERPYYKELFAEAYPFEKEVTLPKIKEALSSFVTSIKSNGSHFDQQLMNSMPVFPSARNGFSALEQKGHDLFFGEYNCGSCHALHSPKGYAISPRNTETLEMVNIGLELNYNDLGLAEITGDNEDRGKFKIPNLRNVELTGPYMHDGRFETLEEVIGHYSDGVKDHRNLDFRLKDENNNPLVFNIPAEDERALLAFLKTLTDSKLVTDVKFSDPFVNN